MVLVILLPALVFQAAAAQATVSERSWEHFGLLNELRAAGFTCPQGQSYAPNPVPLKFDCRLWRASQLHSQDMADNSYFSHTSQNGQSPWSRALEQGISANGENIAAGSSTALATLEQWKRSDGHCRNMMNPNFKLFAVGYGYNPSSPYRHYWTQMFRSSETELDMSCFPVPTTSEEAVASTEEVTTTQVATTTEATTTAAGSDGDRTDTTEGAINDVASTSSRADTTAQGSATMTTTTSLAAEQLVRGHLMLAVADPIEFLGSGAEVPIAASIAELANVSEGAVSVAMSVVSRRLRAPARRLASGRVMVAYTIQAPPEKSAQEVAQGLASLHLFIVAAAVNVHLQEAGLGGIFVQVLSLRASQPPADEPQVNKETHSWEALAIAGGSLAGALILLSAVCCRRRQLRQPSQEAGEAPAGALPTLMRGNTGELSMKSGVTPKHSSQEPVHSQVGSPAHAGEDAISVDSEPVLISRL